MRAEDCWRCTVLSSAKVRRVSRTVPILCSVSREDIKSIFRDDRDEYRKTKRILKELGELSIGMGGSA